MADGKVVIDVVLNDSEFKKGMDDIANSLKSITSILKGFGSFFGNIFSTLGSKISSLNSLWGNLSKVIGSTGAIATTAVAGLVVGFNSLYEKSKQNFGEGLQKLGQVASAVGKVIAGLAQDFLGFMNQVGNMPLSFGDILSEFAAYQSTMQEVLAISGATKDEFRQMNQIAQELGRTTQFSASEAASGLKMLSMAGWSARDSMTGLSHVLRLSQIGGSQLGETADIVSDVIQAMGMSATDCGDMVDMMAATMTNSNTNVLMMGETMKYAASVAGSLGVEFSDLAVATGLLANAGIKSTRAGTTLRTMLTNLTGGTEKAKETMQKYGIELAKADENSMDLKGTLVNLRTALKDLPFEEKVQAAKDLFGRTGMGGGLAIINASEDAFNDLTEAVEGSTTSMTYWREQCEKAGLSEEKTKEKLSQLRSVFTESKDAADALGISSDSLTKTISLLGNDGEVTTQNVMHLFDAMDKLNNASDETKKKMQEYGIEIAKTKDGALDYDTSLKNLVTSLRGKTEAERASILTSLGLANSINEINELCSMTPKKFDEICKGIDEVQSAAEKAQKIIDDSLVGAVKRLASAVYGAGIVLIGQFAPAMGEVIDWLAILVTKLTSGDLNGALEYFKNGMKSAIDAVRNADFSGAMATAFNGINKFITGGGLSSLLNLGGEIISKICKGITDNKKNIEEVVSNAIGEIAKWVTKYAPDIAEAGKVIIDSITKGIKENRDSISDALEGIANIFNTWAASSGSLEAACGTFSKVFIDSLGTQIKIAAQSKVGEIWEAIKGVFSSSEPPTNLFEGKFDNLGQQITGEVEKSLESAKKGESLWDKIKGLLFGEAHADEVTGNETPLNTSSMMDSAGIEQLKTSLSSLQSEVNTISQSISTSFTGMTDSIRTAMLNASNIVNNQFTNMNNGIRTAMLSCTNIVTNQFTNMNNAVRTASLNMSNIITNQFTNMNNAIRTSMVNCTNIITNQFTNMNNAIRTSALNMSNIVRNQFVNMANIVRNQMVNCSNIVRNQFVSMANVCRNQAVNMANIVRNQFLNIANIVRNQMTNARTVFTEKMMSMAAVARNQMANIKATMSSQFSNIRSIIASQMSAARSTFSSQMSAMASTAFSQARAVGANLSRGLASGIQAYASQAIAAARNMVNQVTAIMNSAAKIHSPSRVTMETGKFLALGLSAGLEDTMPQVLGLASNKVNELTSRMRQAVEYEVAKVNLNATTTSNSKITNVTENETKLRNEDIENLVNAINSRQVIVEATIDKKNLVSAIAQNVNDYIDTQRMRKSRLGVT